MINKELDESNAFILRSKAEELLKEKQQKLNITIFDSDTNKLLHELQLHELELEMQNQELRQANVATETALKKYTLLYDLAPVGYFTILQNGIISELNFTGAKLLGGRRFSLVDCNFDRFISEDSKLEFHHFLEAIFKDNKKENCEIMLEYNKKPLGKVYMEGITTGEDQKCLVSMIDISRFKK